MRARARVSECVCVCVCVYVCMYVGGHVCNEKLRRGARADVNTMRAQRDMLLLPPPPPPLLHCTTPSMRKLKACHVRSCRYRTAKFCASTLTPTRATHPRLPRPSSPLTPARSRSRRLPLAAGFFLNVKIGAGEGCVDDTPTGACWTEEGARRAKRVAGGGRHKAGRRVERVKPASELVALESVAVCCYCYGCSAASVVRATYLLTYLPTVPS